MLINPRVELLSLSNWFWILLSVHISPKLPENLQVLFTSVEMEKKDQTKKQEVLEDAYLHYAGSHHL